MVLGIEQSLDYSDMQFYYIGLLVSLRLIQEGLADSTNIANMLRILTSQKPTI